MSRVGEMQPALGEQPPRQHVGRPVHTQVHAAGTDPGRGRAMARDSNRRSRLPLTTVRHGTTAAPQPARRAATRPAAVTASAAASGSASALSTRATATAAGLRPAAILSTTA
jgi:hypothetical protein